MAKIRSEILPNKRLSATPLCLDATSHNPQNQNVHGAEVGGRTSDYKQKIA
jgi:hypothetical protein